jgi:hypothetical protein
LRYLVSGSTATLRRMLPRHARRLGFLTAPANGNSVRTILSLGIPWAADNGAYSDFNPAAFRRMLRRIAGQPGCLFVACPDVVADARATLARFAEWRDEVTAVGHPVAFVGQDGAEDTDIPWGAFDAWFVGGSDNWKLCQASADLTAEAKRRGKYAHMGRVNSLRRMTAAIDMGCDSVDGSSASMFGEKYIIKYCNWLVRLAEQRTIWSAKI